MPLPYSLFCRLLIILGVFFTSVLHSQEWQWGAVGGSVNGFQPGLGNDKNVVLDIAKDNGGNIYTLALVGGKGLKVSDSALRAYADLSMTDMVLSKFTTTGSYKWSKVIGGSGSCLPQRLMTDTLGHVYVLGQNYSHFKQYFGGDTSTYLQAITINGCLL